MRKIHIPKTKKTYLLLSIGIVITHLFFNAQHLLNTQNEPKGTIIFQSKVSLAFFINHSQGNQRQSQIEHESFQQILEGKKYENEFKFPEIDVVYTYVNNKDKEWLDSKNNSYREFLVENMQDNKTKEDVDQDLAKNNNANRYREHDELRYSMRSLLKYASWINKIHLVVSNHNQVPPWLNTSHPKINIVTHSDIFENKSYLPTFNANAIESQLDNIPGLTDYYLYFNDDMFLGRNVTQYDFFALKSSGEQKLYDEGWSARSVCSMGCDYRWLKNKRCDPACNVASCNFDYGDCGMEEMQHEKARIKDQLRFNNNHLNLKNAGFWDNAKYVDGVLNREFQHPPTKARNVIRHTPYLINKRIMKDLKKRFYEEFDWTASHKFRHPEDMQLSFSYFHYLDIVRVYAPTSSQAWHSAFLTINNPEEKIFLYDKLPSKWDDIESQRYYNISNSTEYQIVRNCTIILNNQICSSLNKNCTKYLMNNFLSTSLCQHTMNKLILKLRLPIHDSKRIGNKNDVDFRMLHNMEGFNRLQLQEVYFQRRKFITINDDMPDYQPKVEDAFRCMFEGLFPDPCPLEVDISSKTKCNNMDDFKNFKPSADDEAEHYRQMRIMKATIGWTLPTTDPSYTAKFQHDTFTMRSDPNDIASMVSSKYAKLFKDRTRTFNTSIRKA